MSIPAVGLLPIAVVSTSKLNSRVSPGIKLPGIVNTTLWILSFSPPKPRLEPCASVSRSTVIPSTSSLTSTLTLLLSISPRSISTPFTTTVNVSVFESHSSIWYKENSTVTSKGLVGSSSSLATVGTPTVVVMAGVLVSRRPRNCVNPSLSTVLPGFHGSGRVASSSSKFSFKSSVSG